MRYYHITLLELCILLVVILAVVGIAIETYKLIK